MNTPIPILLIEDNPGDVFLIRELLGDVQALPSVIPGFELECADRLSAGLERLAARDFGLVLLDLSLPDAQGLNTFLEMHHLAPDVPIVVLTSLDDEALALQAIQAGAQDYLVKGQVSCPVLTRTLRYAIERKRTEEALKRAYNELEKRVEERTAELREANQALQTVSQAAQAVQRVRTPEEVYAAIGDQVTRLGCHAFVLTLTEDQKHLEVAHLTFDPGLLREGEKLTGISPYGYQFPLLPGGYLQQVLTQGETLFVESPAELFAEALPEAARPQAGQVAALLNVGPSFVAPLRAGPETYGLLAVTGAPLTEAHAPAATVFASQVAIALENARLFSAVREQREQLRALAARLAETEEAERKKLAQELHDRVGQNLTSLSINLNVVRGHLAGTEAEKMTARLDDSLELVEETGECIRDVMAELRPAALDDYGLRAGLRWYGERFSRRTGVAVTVQGKERTHRLRPSVEIALFRIAQEALTNVAKHAQARQVTVTLDVGIEEVRLTLADDGGGFDPTILRGVGETSGWGLALMRERAAAVGGRLRVESAPGEGTQIVVEIGK